MAPPLDPNAPVQQPQQSQQPQGSGQGFFGKIGSFLKQNSGAIADIGNQLAAAGGNLRPLLLAHQDREFQLQKAKQDTESQLAQSQMQNQALSRELLGKQNADFQTHEQRDASALALKRAETPTTYQTDEDQTGIANTDLSGKTTPRMVDVPNPELRDYGMAQQRTADFNRNFPGGQVPTPPPTMPPTTIQRPAILPQTVGFHAQDPVTGLMYEYAKGGLLLGTQPGPANPNAPLIPGMGKVNPIDAGAAGSLPPDPRSYPQGAKDPAFRNDYQKFLASASNAKQANAIAAAGARGAAFNASKPITTLDASSGQDVISTLGDERRAGRGTPGNPILAGNQSGAFNVGQKTATFREMDQNIQNVNQALDAAVAANGGSLGDITHRTAFAAALNPSEARSGLINEIPGVSLLKGGIEAAGLSQLAPAEQKLVFAARNMRQGAAGLKNVLSQNGISDHRVATLESELLNEADILNGDPQAIKSKLASFGSIYNEIVSSYPGLVTNGGPTNRGALQQPRANAAPPTKPAVASSGKPVIKYDTNGNRL